MFKFCLNVKEHYFKELNKKIIIRHSKNPAWEIQKWGEVKLWQKLDNCVIAEWGKRQWEKVEGRERDVLSTL